MTPEQINEAIARKLGWKPCSCIGGPHEKEHRAYMPSMNHKVPDFCRSIEAAFEILDRMFSVKIEKISDEWQCELGDGKNGDEFASADKLPMAIALAFLKLP